MASPCPPSPRTPIRPHLAGGSSLPSDPSATARILVHPPRSRLLPAVGHGPSSRRKVGARGSRWRRHIRPTPQTSPHTCRSRTKLSSPHAVDPHLVLAQLRLAANP